MEMKVKALDHFVLTVADIGSTIAFYQVLGMTVDVFSPADGSKRTALSFGSQKINLHVVGAEFRPHAKAPLPGTADFCLLTETPVQDWLAHLENHGIKIIEGPIRRTGATGPILSIYVRDPDGNLIEVANPV